jgi:acetoin utilization protein AcuC
VLTISIHERGDRLFPGTGFVDELGEGAGRGYSVNLPLEVLTDSSIYLPAFEAVVPPLVKAFRPDVMVAQLGIDSHRTDPLTHLALDVQGFAQAVRRLVALAPRLVALGGGGYDIGNVARAWTAAWAVMNGLELPAALPEAFLKDAGRFGVRATTLNDPPAPLDDERRRLIQEYVDRQVDAVQRLIFPLHRL